MRNRFYLRPLKSPTFCNLVRYLQEQGWKRTGFKFLADFSEAHFQYNPQAKEQLEFKHLLAQLIAQHCPDVMPTTYLINDDNWSLVLSRITDDYYRQNKQVFNQRSGLAWILKPSLLNNGQYIKIFQKITDIELHFLSTNRMGGEHVLQQYLIDPHLLKGPEKGHKYSIRMFVVLTNTKGAYLYPQGYFNVALKAYQNQDFTDLRSHLTNEHLNEHVLNVVQIPTKQYALFNPFYPKIKSILSEVLSALAQLHPNVFDDGKPPKLAIFGFDFLIDQDQKVWLLEANDAPCFPADDDHPLQNNLYYDFWQAFIANFILPIANHEERNSTPQFFDSIDIFNTRSPQ